jgi:hypothetical protein
MLMREMTKQTRGEKRKSFMDLWLLLLLDYYSLNLFPGLKVWWIDGKVPDSRAEGLARNHKIFFSSGLGGFP